MRIVTAILLLALAACSEPRLNANVSLGAGGVSVRPAVSGNVGGVGVTLTP
jgi:hypothetical protein